MQLRDLLAVIVVSDVKVMSSTVTVILDACNIWTKPRFFNRIQVFFSQNQIFKKPNQNKTVFRTSLVVAGVISMV